MPTDMLDFSITPPLIAAFVLAGLNPAWLAALARLPGLCGRNPLQFLLSTSLSFAAWAAYLLYATRSQAIGVSDVLLGFMAMAAATLVYLEIWALLSRGYTLSLLLALLRAEGPMSAEALAAVYRGGEGLSWVFRHRLSGLVKAGLIERANGTLMLKAPLGVTIAVAYKGCIAFLGLKRTG
jgi:hypothetical protein